MTFRPKLIENENEYKAALTELRALWDIKPEQGTPEFDQGNLLAHLVSEYENMAFPIDLPDPAAVLEFYMDQNGLDQADLSALLQSKSRASEILGRKKALSITQVRAIHAQWGIPVDFLIQPLQVVGLPANSR